MKQTNTLKSLFAMAFIIMLISCTKDSYEMVARSKSNLQSVPAQGNIEVEFRKTIPGITVKPIFWPDTTVNVK